MVARRKQESTSSSTPPAVKAGLNGEDFDINKILDGDYSSGQAQAVVAKTRDVVANTRVREEIGAFADQAVDLMKMTDEEKLKVKASILQARIEEMRQALPDDKRALGTLVSTLNSSFQELREGFDKIAEYDADEQKVLSKAEDVHSSATADLIAANEQLVKAKNRTGWFGIRERAVVAAQSTIAIAEQAEKEAKTAIEVATATAQKMRDERLQGADFEESFTFIQACVKETMKAIKGRIDNLTFQASEAEAKRKVTYDRKEAAAGKIETWQGKVDELAARYQQESDVRDQLPAGSSERVKAEAKAAATKHEFEEARASHDQQLAIYQEMETGVKALEIEEVALRAGLHAHKVELARLAAGADVWIVEAQNRIAAVKSLASQQASKGLMDVEVAARQDNVNHAAKFAVASLLMVTEQAEQHPEIMDALDVSGNAMADGLLDVAQRWKAVDDRRKASRGVATQAQ